MKRHLQTAAFIFLLAVFYFCAGSFGLSLASINPSASAVWPPSGIALATLLVFGYRLWPGIFLGAGLVNFFAQGSLVTALTIAAGNTFEALLGTWLVRRFAEGTKAFDQTKNILRFILLAAILSTTVAATVGATSLSLADYARWEDYAAIWLTWWLGDTVGILVITPLLVLWLTQSLWPLKTVQVLEAVGLLLTLVVVGWLLFLNSIPSGLEYFALLPLLWAALRFGRRGAVTATFIMSCIALLGTVKNFGPFATFHTNDSLLLLQLFMATVTTTALVMASVVTERRRFEQRLRTKDAVSQILAESPAINDAAPKIIQAICETAGWILGAIWKVDPASNELVCVDVWSLPPVDARAFVTITWQSRFGPGIGLPGRVWSSGKPTWILDVTRDGNFPRARAAVKEGLHTAFGFPIKVADKVLGIIECFSREVREPDDSFLEMVGHVGNQLGQFLERKRAEDALRESEGRLQVALSAGHMGTWEWDMASNQVTWSTTLEAIHGLKPGTFGQRFEDFKNDILPEDLAFVLARINQTVQTRSDYEIAYRIRRPDGAVRWVEAFGRIVFGADGQPEKLAGVCMDTTERKQAEEMLRQRTRSLEIINRTGNAMAGELELDKIVQLVTDAGREISGAEFGAFFYNATNENGESRFLYALSGMSREVFEKLGIPRNSSLFGPTLRGEGVIRIDDVLADPRYGKNLPYQGMPEGHPPVRSYLAVPVIARSGEVLGGLFFGHPEPRVFTAEAENIIMAIAAQASVAFDKANLYQAVQRRVEEFQKLIDTAPVGIAVAADAECRHIWGNTEFNRMLGADEHRNISKSGVAGDQLPFRIFHNGQEVPVESLPMQRACRQGIDVLDEELEIVRHDGTLIHEICRAIPLRDEHGKVRGCIGIFLNISDRKQAEAALQQAKNELARTNESLERRVQERTADLEQVNMALLRKIEEEKRLEEQLRQAQKLESIGTLTGGIAHDFNNILNIIRGHTSFIAEMQSSEQELATALSIIDETIDRGSAIVQQLLAIAKRSEVKSEQVNLNVLVTRLERLISETFPKTIDIILRLDPRLPPVTADPNQIDQVLLNIALNARDAMPEGGKLLLTTATVSGAELRALFQEAKAQEYTLITITDTGAGMDESVRNRIFEPFFSTKQQAQGTGLGLSVAYGIVANHRGFIDVTSRPNQGTTFSIYLPIGDTRPRLVAEKPPFDKAQPGNSPLEHHTVLFVEDEVRQLELMRRLLERNGYQVLTSTSGSEAVEIHSRHKDKISVVVLDLGLPGLNGWEAFQKMKQVNPTLKAILATGYISPEIELATSKGELSAVIMKPYQLNEILSVLSSAALSAQAPDPNRPNRKLIGPLR